ncbi:MAG: GNAT family N-acetyltransferase [Desulfobacter sp.]
MEITRLDLSDIHLIQPLWEQLNRLHRERSNYFTAQFDRFTFADRVRELETKSRTGIFVARDGDGKAVFAYCIASLESGVGEIDSLYVSPDCRGNRVGHHLMETALAWLSGHGYSKIRISVVHGNEQALGFYEKFGFRQRLVILEQT